MSPGRNPAVSHAAAFDGAAGSLISPPPCFPLANAGLSSAHRGRTANAANDTIANEGLGSAPGLQVEDVESGARLFTPLELLVIGVGARDRATFVNPKSLLARLGRMLFGIEAPAPFADARLETLRSLAVASRRGRRTAARAIAAALTAGFTRAQIEQLVSRVQDIARRG